MSATITVCPVGDRPVGAMHPIECPRHGSMLELSSGRPLCLPAYERVDTFPVRVEDGEFCVEVQ